MSTAAIVQALKEYIKDVAIKTVNLERWLMTEAVYNDDFVPEAYEEGSSVVPLCSKKLLLLFTIKNWVMKADDCPENTSKK